MLRASLALTFLSVAPAVVRAQDEVGPNDFRISEMGVDGSASLTGVNPAVAYNPVDREFLVVWSGDDLVNTEHQIHGQRIDALTGLEVGVDDFLISDAENALEPAVVYNAVRHEYLVVWHGLGKGGPFENEIYGQRLDASTGLQVGADDFRISAMGPDGDNAYVAYQAAVAHSALRDEYLVVWTGVDDRTGAPEQEVYAQRLDGATGAELGADDLRVSDMGPDGSLSWAAVRPDVAWNALADRYAVVWAGEDDLPGLVPGEQEVYLQVLDGATGAEVGANDARLSAFGPDGNADFDVRDPAIVHNAVHDEYLVVWSGAESIGMADEFAEIYAQRVDGSTGAEVGPDDLRISELGSGPEDAFSAYQPDVAFTPLGGEYVVAFYGDDDTPPQIDGDLEVFVQRLDGATGAEVGPDDQRITDIGPDGQPLFPAGAPAVGLAPEVARAFVAFQAADEPPLAIFEFEIHGQLLEFCPAALPASEVARLGTPPNPSALLPGVTSPPILGAVWDPVIDHASFAPGAVLDVLGIGTGAIDVPAPPLGTLLLDPGTLLAVPTAPPGVPFAVPVPDDCTLIGLPLVAQGASADATGAFQLANALDVTVGTL